VTRPAVNVIPIDRLPSPDQWEAYRKGINDEAARREAAEEKAVSLISFLRSMWSVIEPHTPLIDNWHIELICDRLEKVSRGEIRRLVINIPPGCGKSIIVSVMWPCWTWLYQPYMRLQCLSHSHGLVGELATKARRIIESDRYKKLQAILVANGTQEHWEMEKDRNRINDYANTASGYRTSLAIGSGVTGRRAYCQIIDDPYDVKEVMLGTPEMVENRMSATADIANKVLANRIKYPNGHESYVLIMQRIHLNDLSARWLRMSGCDHLVLPMNYNPTHPYVCPDDPRTEPGELLFERLYSKEEVEESRGQLGDTAPGQLDQLPHKLEGGIYPVDQIGTFEGDPQRLRVDAYYISIDANFKKTSKGSFFVAGVWGIRYRDKNHKAFDRFRLDEYRARNDHFDNKMGCRALFHKWPQAHTKLVEDMAGGSAIVSDLSREYGGVTPFKRGTEEKAIWNQVHGKPPVAAGEVFYPSPEFVPEVQSWRDELKAFPAEPNDRGDEMAQLFAYLDGEALNGPAARLQRQAEVLGLL